MPMPGTTKVYPLYVNLHLKGLGVFPRLDNCWSSSERGAEQAWFLQFKDGRPEFAGKEQCKNIIAVRAF